MRIIFSLIMSCILLSCAPPPSSEILSLEGTPRVTQQADNSSKVFEAQKNLINKIWQRYPSVEADVRWVSCRGELNSYYYPTEKTIYLCTEFAAYPKVALFVAAHEFGHAIAIQLVHVRDEEAADEIAALEMLRLDMGYELLEAALYFKIEGDSTPPSSGHPSDTFRGWNLACMAAGADGHPFKCVTLYLGTKARWNERLKDFQDNT